MNDGTIRHVISALSIICILSIGGIVLLPCLGVNPPEALASMATVSIGALVGILATPRPPTSQH